MKKVFILIFIFLINALSININKNDVVGTWLTQEKDGKFSIYEKNGKYYGKLIWGKNPDKLDTENPDEKLRTRKIVGSIILTDFEWDSDEEEWVDGEIYDPRNGDTFSCKMWFDESKDRLNIRGYVGFSLLGKTVQWTRVKK